MADTPKSYNPGYVPEGAANRINEYEETVNHVKLARVDHNRSEYFGTIGGIPGIEGDNAFVPGDDINSAGWDLAGTFAGSSMDPTTLTINDVSVEMDRLVGWSNTASELVMAGGIQHPEAPFTIRLRFGNRNYLFDWDGSAKYVLDLGDGASGTGTHFYNYLNGNVGKTLQFSGFAYTAATSSTGSTAASNRRGVNANNPGSWATQRYITLANEDGVDETYHLRNWSSFSDANRVSRLKMAVSPAALEPGQQWKGIQDISALYRGSRYNYRWDSTEESYEGLTEEANQLLFSSMGEVLGQSTNAEWEVNQYLGDLTCGSNSSDRARGYVGVSSSPYGDLDPLEITLNGETGYIRNITSFIPEDMRNHRMRISRTAGGTDDFQIGSAGVLIMNLLGTDYRYEWNATESSYDGVSQAANDQMFDSMGTVLGVSTPIRIVQDGDAATGDVPQAVEITDYLVFAADEDGTIDFTVLNEPEDGILDYEYQIDKGAWTSSGVNTTNETWQVSGLNPWEPYHVDIRKVNANGAGPNSGQEEGKGTGPGKIVRAGGHPALAIEADVTSGTAPLVVAFNTIGESPLNAKFTGYPWLDFHVVWDFDDSNAGNAGSHIPSYFPFRSKNTSYKHRVSHNFDQPGTYNVEARISDGVSTVIRSITITVNDPATVYAGDKTVCYSPTGDFTDAPSGSIQISTSLADAMAQVTADKRLLLQGGATYLETLDSDDSPSTTDLIVGTYGDGMANFDQAASNKAAFVIVRDDMTGLCQFENIYGFGNYDPVNPSTDQLFVDAFKSVRFVGKMVLLRCKAKSALTGFFFSGEEVEDEEAGGIDFYKAQSRAEENVRGRFFAVECESWDCKNFAARSNGNYDAMHYLDCYIHQNPAAEDDSDGKQDEGIQADHLWRASGSNVSSLTVDLCRGFSTTSWAPGTQEALRTFTGNREESDMNLLRSIFEGGSRVISTGTTANSSTFNDRPCYANVHMNVLASSEDTSRILQFTSGGLMFVGNILIYPENDPKSENSIEYRSVLWNDTDGSNTPENDRFPIRIAMNQFVGLWTDKMQILEDAYDNFLDLVVEYNVEHFPNKTPPVTDREPLDTDPILELSYDASGRFMENATVPNPTPLFGTLTNSSALNAAGAGTGYLSDWTGEYFDDNVLRSVGAFQTAVDSTEPEPDTPFGTKNPIFWFDAAKSESIRDSAGNDVTGSGIEVASLGSQDMPNIMDLTSNVTTGATTTDARRGRRSLLFEAGAQIEYREDSPEGVTQNETWVFALLERINPDTDHNIWDGGPGANSFRSSFRSANEIQQRLTAIVNHDTVARTTTPCIVALQLSNQEPCRMIFYPVDGAREDFTHDNAASDDWTYFHLGARANQTNWFNGWIWAYEVYAGEPLDPEEITEYLENGRRLLT